ncbi:MAG: hypothetical protein HXS41_09095 [Theionarchaea archaeon]|nr:hypothetical protein [Theionarchaea archaeon]
MKESNSKHHKAYKLQVQPVEFATRWILTMIAEPLFLSSFFAAGRIDIKILLDIIFYRKFAPFEVIRESTYSNVDIPFLIFLIFLALYFIQGLRLYYRKDKDYYIEISDMGLLLDYGRKSVPWDEIDSLMGEY